jgi:NADP-dependent 3-hydroxy acid dehydrogenase YdfG
MSDNIRGTVVAITGASSGLGAATGFSPRRAGLSWSAHGAAIVPNTR